MTGRGLTSLLLLSIYATGWAETPWWNDAWKFRGKVEITASALASGIDAAAVEFPLDLLGTGDAAGIRVVDSKGNETPFAIKDWSSRAVTFWFKDAVAAETEFYLYWGNPAAPQSFYRWTPRTAELNLETRTNKRRRNANSFEEMKSMVEESDVIFGRGRQANIDSLENPFGPNTDYLSSYKGAIICWESGQYEFATNSDDASFLLVDGKIVAQWPGGHEKGGGANAPAVDVWTAVGKLVLARGMHLVEYYLEQGQGSSLARAAWKRPGDRDFSIIPARAFSGVLPARLVSREERGAAVNPYFTVEIRERVRFYRNREFVSFRFRDATTGPRASSARREWLVDGKTAGADSELRCVFPAGTMHAIVLKIGNEEVSAARYSREIFVSDNPGAEIVRIDMGVNLPVDGAAPAAGEKISCWVRNFSGKPVSLELSTVLTEDAEAETPAVPFTLGPYETCSFSVDAPVGQPRDSITWRLGYGGNELLRARSPGIAHGYPGSAQSP